MQIPTIRMEMVKPLFLSFYEDYDVWMRCNKCLNEYYCLMEQYVVSTMTLTENNNNALITIKSKQ